MMGRMMINVITPSTLTASPARILIVDDELSIRTLLARYLQQQEHLVEIASSADQALDIFRSFRPNLVILDLNLPDGSGYEICPIMQAETGVLVMMLTSRVETADRLQGFHQGADDYITKPFNLPEVGARVSALLKRQRMTVNPVNQIMQFGNLIINPETREVRRDDEDIPLTALEFNLLLTMARVPGRVWRRAELISSAWQGEYTGDERVVDVHIGQIRKKLESSTDQPEYIRTVRGVGYKFESAVS